MIKSNRRVWIIILQQSSHLRVNRTQCCDAEVKKPAKGARRVQRTWSRLVEDLGVQDLQLRDFLALLTQLEPVIALQTGEWIVGVGVAEELYQTEDRPAVLGAGGEEIL